MTNSHIREPLTYLFKDVSRVIVLFFCVGQYQVPQNRKRRQFEPFKHSQSRPIANSYKMIYNSWKKARLDKRCAILSRKCGDTSSFFYSILMDKRWTKCPMSNVTSVCSRCTHPCDGFTSFLTSLIAVAVSRQVLTTTSSTTLPQNRAEIKMLYGKQRPVAVTEHNILRSEKGLIRRIYAVSVLSNTALSTFRIFFQHGL